MSETSNVTLRGAAPRVAITAACARIAPLWPLNSFVAVNPFVGLAGKSFTDAAKLFERTGHASVMMSADYYREKLRAGQISADDIAAALEILALPVPVADLVSWLNTELSTVTASERLLTVADSLDRSGRANWSAFVVDEISKWCASYFDEGQSAWRMPWGHLPLYAAWKRAAELDANPEVFGLKGFREWVRSLPDNPEETIELVLERLNIGPEDSVDFLHRQLLSVAGWSGYAGYRDWRNTERKTLTDLLAIRVAWDGALQRVCPGWKLETIPSHDGFSEAKLIAQLATEHAFRSQVARMIAIRHPQQHKRKALQAVFCIDVRSEVYRRALEAQSGDIATIGFAGFFGMPIQLGASALCPVLVEPQYRLEAMSAAGSVAAEVWNNLKSSATACFPAVEVAGAAFGLAILKEFFGGRRHRRPTPIRWNIPLAERTALVANALKNMSLDVGVLAPVVLLCGHGARTENNPYAASLDCGACGGHTGEFNARFAAALMNDPEVRPELRRQGIYIPEDTVFIAGRHETTTEDVVLYDADCLNRQQREQVKNWLLGASAAARQERCGGNAKPGNAFHRRAADWSEVRPEWGLAGNAAFIAAPRWRTEGLNLGGRVFLHDYDPGRDPDASTLTLILTAPVVVASWINLQYYGSTVDNRLFGSGNKALHNVVGKFGIWEGNAGDLRAGLPIQSLHDGKDWVHEPLRLQVFVEASRKVIDGVLNENPSAGLLADNGWIQLIALEGKEVYIRAGGEWRSERN